MNDIERFFWKQLVQKGLKTIDRISKWCLKEKQMKGSVMK